MALAMKFPSCMVTAIAGRDPHRTAELRMYHRNVLELVVRILIVGSYTLGLFMWLSVMNVMIQGSS